MQRVNESTVTLTDDEVVRYERFHRLLDVGHGIPLAAKLALNLPGEPVSTAFVEYLSEGTVERWGTRFRIRPEFRQQAAEQQRQRPHPCRCQHGKIECVQCGWWHFHTTTCGGRS